LNTEFFIAKKLSFNKDNNVRIANLDSNYSFDTPPIQNDYEFYGSIAVLPEVKHIQQYAYKGGSFFEQYMVEGDLT
jgi:hypothetical protein